MKKLTLAGHPLHPQLVATPLGLLPFSFVMDLAHHITGDDAFADTSYHAMVGGVVGAMAAGASGAADYMTIPSGTHIKKLANTHAILNIGVLGLYMVNLAMRRPNRRPTVAATVLNGVCAAGLMVSQWYGGHLVYEHGVRVSGKSPIEGAAQATLPGDKAMSRGLEAVSQVMPSAGPVSATPRQD